MQRKEVVRNNFNDSPYPYVKIINNFFTHLQVKMQIINVRDVNAIEIIIPTRDIVFKDCFSSNTSRNKHLFVSLQDQKLRIIMHQYIKKRSILPESMAALEWQNLLDGCTGKLSFYDHFRLLCIRFLSICFYKQ